MAYKITATIVTADSDLIHTFAENMVVHTAECLHCGDSATGYKFADAVEWGEDHFGTAFVNTGKVNGCIPVDSVSGARGNWPNSAFDGF